MGIFILIICLIPNDLTFFFVILTINFKIDPFYYEKKTCISEYHKKRTEKINKCRNCSAIRKLFNLLFNRKTFEQPNNKHKRFI